MSRYIYTAVGSFQSAQFTTVAGKYWRDAIIKIETAKIPDFARLGSKHAAEMFPPTRNLDAIPVPFSSD
jgi:hypothetical protein